VRLLSFISYATFPSIYNLTQLLEKEADEAVQYRREAEEARAAADAATGEEKKELLRIVEEKEARAAKEEEEAEEAKVKFESGENYRRRSGGHTAEELMSKLKEQLIIECEQWSNNCYDIRCDYLCEHYPELFELGELAETDSTAERVVVASVVKVGGQHGSLPLTGCCVDVNVTAEYTNF
jgi:hypothetical protein